MRASERIVEREVKDGDKAIATVHMFLDKVQLEDGHHHDLTILMGKDYLLQVNWAIQLIMQCLRPQLMELLGLLQLDLVLVT